MTPAEEVAFWNMDCPVGTSVRLATRMHTTRAPAQILSDGCAVVWLDGLMGAVEISRLVRA